MLEGQIFLKTHLESTFPGSHIEIIGNLPRVRERNDWLFYVAFELTANSLQEGAKKVELIRQKGLLQVSDDVIHQDVDSLLANINSEEPRTTKGTGGMGIWGSRRAAMSHGGTLIYSAVAGKIIAEMRWKED